MMEFTSLGLDSCWETVEIGWVGGSCVVSWLSAGAGPESWSGPETRCPPVGLTQRPGPARDRHRDGANKWLGGTAGLSWCLNPKADKFTPSGLCQSGSPASGGSSYPGVLGVSDGAQLSLLGRPSWLSWEEAEPLGWEGACW